ncbi:hypothetical protein RchiOBHm_Chr5g0038571 [Rosa chinensis]|uniref:Uncharacterized protein n=1 Tax=Rosa chinensis TaxID=74649 RepID=A0A2P6QC27_ROSCH|nr:hypothetical protein RchiOBHm_Chr5g0038571 [Rosa chinensis]
MIFCNFLFGDCRLYRSGAKRQFCKLLRKESRTQNKILYFISLVFKTRSISCQADNNNNKSDLHPLLWGGDHVQ